MAVADAVTDAIAALTAGPLAARTELDAAIGPLTTYRVGGPARALVTLDDDDDATSLALVVARTGVPTLVYCRGSNIMVDDQ